MHASTDLLYGAALAAIIHTKRFQFDPQVVWSKQADLDEAGIVETYSGWRDRLTRMTNFEFVEQPDFRFSKQVDFRFYRNSLTFSSRGRLTCSSKVPLRN